MKNMIRKLTSAFCASIILFTVSSPSVMAEDEEKFPSGIKQSEFEYEMTRLPNISEPNISDKNDSFDYTESGAVGVFRGDKILYTNYYGATDRANNKAVDSDSVFEWGSISKTLIWVSVMQLKEQGKIDLDRDVREYLPEGFFQHLSYAEPITMMNLMNHTAGWQESTSLIFVTAKNELKHLGDALQDEGSRVPLLALWSAEDVRRQRRGPPLDVRAFWPEGSQARQPRRLAQCRARAKASFL